MEERKRRIVVDRKLSSATIDGRRPRYDVGR